MVGVEGTQIPGGVIVRQFSTLAGNFQSFPLGMNRLYGRNAAQVVTCTAITVPIVKAPFGTAVLHRADPVTPSDLAIIPLPKPPAVAPMSQQYQNGFGGKFSGESVVDRKV